MTDIVLINYLEKDFQKTIECCEQLNQPMIVQDRHPKGVGSLAEAINYGFRKVRSDYFLVCTNVTFDPAPIKDFIQLKGHSVVQPTFLSDHMHLRKRDGSGAVNVPFTEFTFVLLHSATFSRLNGVDQRMPYVGFDIDYGIRANNLVGGVMVHLDYSVEHTYNRFMPYSPVTAMRKRMRRQAEDATYLRLKELYGIERRTRLTTYPWINHIDKYTIEPNKVVVINDLKDNPTRTLPNRTI